MSERIYRDPVHNIIRLDMNSTAGALLVRLVDAAEFQRLRRIRQLGLAAFAYQGAEHSRFSHSLGAFHLVSRILERLSAKYPISDDDCLTIQCAALLHDIGHGAFSHVLESILDFHHEDFTVAAILSSETEVGRLLREFSSEMPARVAAVIKGEFKPVALAQLVSSQLDVDRMDYLLRDSLMTGAKYGIYDLEWIVKTIEIDAASDCIYVSANGLYAVEDYLQARYYMFRQVYFHRTLRSAEIVLRGVLRRALELFEAGKFVWFAAGTSFEKILRRERLNLSEHLAFDDNDIWFHIKQWQTSDDLILANLSQRFVNRRLFKAFDLDMSDSERETFLIAGRAIIEDAGFPADYYFIEDSAGDLPYNAFAARNKNQRQNLIFVEAGFSQSEIREISTVSSAVRGLQQPFSIRRVCFPEQLQPEIAALYRK